jgi:aarF domain-containing kinase
LAFLDAGICTELSRPSRHAFVKIMYHAARGDGEKVAQAVLDTAPEHDCNDPEGFVRAITAIVEDMQERELNNEEREVVRMTRRRQSKEERAVADAKEGADLQKKAADAVGRIFETCRQYRVKLDGSLSSVVIATFILEGLGRSLDPQLDIFHAALPLLMASPFAR